MFRTARSHRADLGDTKGVRLQRNGLCPENRTINRRPGFVWVRYICFRNGKFKHKVWCLPLADSSRRGFAPSLGNRPLNWSGRNLGKVQHKVHDQLKLRGRRSGRPKTFRLFFHAAFTMNKVPSSSRNLRSVKSATSFLI